MARPKLKVSKRELVGRKVKKLRAEDLLPGNIFGHKVKSLSIQLPVKDFRPVYGEIGETGLVDLEVEGEKSVRPVLVHNVQVDPVSAHLLHVDFHQVDLTQKVKASIPVEIVGESPAVAQKLGILVRLVDEIEVEALPTDLPEKIEVDITSLVKVGDMIKLGQVKIDSKVAPSLEAEEPLAKIEPPTKIEEEKPVAEEEVEEGAGAEEGERPETEAGEKPEPTTENSSEEQ